MEKEEANRILAGVDGERCFWINNGPVLKNLDELYKALGEIKKEMFTHHVNDGKNDFSNWVRDVLGDQKLAEDITNAKSKREMASKVKQRMRYLKKVVS